MHKNASRQIYELKSSGGEAGQFIVSCPRKIRRASRVHRRAPLLRPRGPRRRRPQGARRGYPPQDCTGGATEGLYSEVGNIEAAPEVEKNEHVWLDGTHDKYATHQTRLSINTGKPTTK